MSMPGGRDMSRAERFEDEKRRIIDSCFNKKDEDGSILETYITHIKIIEYAASPTSPPPPELRNNPSAEKPRVIIVAVRKSGRVRMHKSKENVNGSFSIGKTWNLDDLTAIESFTSATANPDYQQWAGDVGFVVTLGKPYYWQAQTDKEKKFFIASLIKIYGKYTGGRSPALSGFDQRELDAVLGGAQTQRPARPPPSRIMPGQVMPGPNSATSSNASTFASQSEQSSYPPQARANRNTPMAPNGTSSPARSFESGPRSQDQGSARDQGSLRRLATSNQSQDSVANSFATRSEDTGSMRQRPGSRNGPNGVNGGNYGTPRGTPPPPPPEQISEEKPPERRRPPMDPLRPTQQADRDLVPAPLVSPNMRRDPIVPPPRSSDRMSPRKPSTRRTDSDRTVTSERTGLHDRAPTVVPKEQTGIDAPGAFPASPLDTPPAAVSPIPGAAPPSVPTTPAFEEPSPVQSPIEPPQESVKDDTRPEPDPMTKGKKSKGEIAGAFWKAAAAAAAATGGSGFKPRPGGAAERIRLAAQAAMAKKEDEPDGITAVVPAPPRPASVQKAPDGNTGPTEPPARSSDRTSGIPEVKVTVPNASRPTSLQTSIQEGKKFEGVVEPEEEKPQRPVVTGNDVKYLATLGVDPSVLDSRSTEFAKWLDYFGWVPGEKMRAKTFDEVKVDVERELNEAQAGGWLTRFREDDERVGAIKKGIDVAINECDELDNLLTLYSVELSTLSDDIAFIEAQGQGLQVQTANQKLLKRELESLLETCAISANDLDPLHSSPLETVGGIEEIEGSLVTLYRAMQRINPDMSSNESRRSEDGSAGQATLDSDFSQMRIVQEKKDMYTAESSLFMRRLVEFMARQFDLAIGATKRQFEGPLSKKMGPENYDAGRELLWQYSPLLLYAKDMDRRNWDRIIQVYQEMTNPLYKNQVKPALDTWKKNARKPTGDESELLFTSLQEKKEEGIATTARKLTVKRSQTLARNLRAPLGDGSSKKVERSTHGKAYAYEVFNGVMDELLPLVEMEQNFIVDFFHATSLEQADFPDAVAAAKPKSRRGGDLKRHRLMEPDRDLARRVTKAMEVIFEFLERELSNLVDWVLSQDPLQGVGVLATLERKMQEMSQTNQDYLNSLLQKLHNSLELRFKRFVDDQIRAIEDTKVKIKKRKGVIGFMRIFPQFLTAVENMLANVDPSLNIRRTVDREYDRILKSMFDSLKVIARETPSVTAGAGAHAGSGNASIMTGTTSATNSSDPEDKEALNFHILLIENMNHYLEEVQNPNHLEVLDDWASAAQQELSEHLSLYLSTIMRRPLGKLLEHLENIESQLASGKPATSIAAQPSNSRSVFNKILSNYDAKEVRKGIETLKKRVEKHFGADDTGDQGQAMKLTNMVLAQCEKFYGEVEVRIARVTSEVYGGDVLFEWPRQEVRGAFGGR